MMRVTIIAVIGLFCLISAAHLVGCAADADKLPEPKVITTGANVEVKLTETQLMSAREYYAFWNTGEERYALKALAPDFIDLNLPEGRPQGLAGPLVASRQFREAVPDLSLSVEHSWVVGDQVISRLRFSGHFTGSFGTRKGDGRAIAFDAVDIYTIKGGQITTNWHLEDNFSLMKQLGAVAP
jgi:predicted ester cyclase